MNNWMLTGTWGEMPANRRGKAERRPEPAHLPLGLFRGHPAKCPACMQEAARLDVDPMPSMPDEDWRKRRLAAIRADRLKLRATHEFETDPSDAAPMFDPDELRRALVPRTGGAGLTNLPDHEACIPLKSPRMVQVSVTAPDADAFRRDSLHVTKQLREAGVLKHEDPAPAYPDCSPDYAKLNREMRANALSAWILVVQGDAHYHETPHGRVMWNSLCQRLLKRQEQETQP